MARSISFHEERKKRSQRTANNIPFLEDLIISTSGSDKYLALVCGANTESNKLHSEDIEKLIPSDKIDQEEGKENQFESDHKNRSKSWHCFPEDNVYSLAQENLSGIEDKHDLGSKGGLGSRSFHTVEEYDDMVNRIWLTKSQIVQQSEFNTEEEDCSVTNMDLQVSELTSNTTHGTVDKDSAINEMKPPCLNKKYSLLEEKEIVKEINIIKNEKVVSSHKRIMLESDSEGVCTIKKGSKRKAIAKKLESLKIPYNIECPAIASVKEWFPTDGIYSPGSYVTPKFGSYSSLMNIGNEKESSEDSVFSPELVSAFEQCMKNFEAEEENILKQILEDVEEESDE